MRAAIAGVGTAIGLSACDVGEGDVCATVMSYAEPVLTITEVLSPEGRPVDTVVLKAFTVDGRPALRMLRDLVRDDARRGRSWEPGTATSGTPLAGLVIGSGGQLVCKVPCAFGNAGGWVELRLVADAGQVTTGAEAAYRTQHSGCGGALDDGTDLVVQLRPTTRS